MIVLGKDKVDERYNISDDGTITDLQGNVQYIGVHQGRPRFHKIAVHQIQMWTKFEWRDTKIWDIHHLDGNKLNNSIDNLEFILHSDHAHNHMKGKKLSDEWKKNIGLSRIGQTSGMKGIHHSEESRKKMSESRKLYLKNLNK